MVSKPLKNFVVVVLFSLSLSQKKLNHSGKKINKYQYKLLFKRKDPCLFQVDWAWF